MKCLAGFAFATLAAGRTWTGGDGRRDPDPDDPSR